jgi:hypothetical protein
VISYAATAVTARTGVATIRGTLDHNTMGVASCDWGSGASCGVDAAYVNWGDGSEGPYPPSGSLVCGAVTVSPWLPSDNTSGLFGSANCDGSATPGAQLSSAEATYSIDVDNEQIQCNNGFEDACQAIQTAQACLSAAYNLAAKTAPFTMPDVGGDPVGAANQFVESLEVPFVATAAAISDFVDQVGSAAETILDVANAYEQCDP